MSPTTSRTPQRVTREKYDALNARFLELVEAGENYSDAIDTMIEQYAPLLSRAYLLAVTRDYRMEHPEHSPSIRNGPTASPKPAPSKAQSDPMARLVLLRLARELGVVSEKATFDDLSGWAWQQIENELDDQP